MQLIEYRFLWTAPSCQTRNVVPGLWLAGNSRSMTSSLLPAKAGALRRCETLEVLEDNSNGLGQREHQEILWRQLFLDPSVWWDCRQHKRTPTSPDFRHKQSNAVLLLSNVYKPAWVEPQLANWDTQMMTTGPAFASTSSWPPVASRHKLAGSVRDVNAEACSRLCDKGQLAEAVDMLDLLVQTGSPVSTSLFYCVIKGCLAQKKLALGRRVDTLALKSGYRSNTFLANHILRMYASHGRLEDATDVFTRVAAPDAFMWSSIISAYAEHENPRQAIELYHRMRSSCLKPDGHVFVAALKACASAADLEGGRQVHVDVVERGLQDNVFVGSCLVEMYCKCGRLEDARRVFDSMSTRDVVTWNSMINGYTDHGLGHDALALYASMEQEGRLVADNVTFSCLLKACASVGSLQQFKQLHLQIMEKGLKANTVISNCLVDMYAKCGSLEDARREFDRSPTKDVVTWNSMINGYTEHGHAQEALALYARMEQEGMILPDKVTFVCLLKACTMVASLQQGRQLHSQIVERGLSTDTVLGNCLVDMYAKCGSLDDSRKVFDSLPTRDVVTWTTMMAGYADHGLGQEALALHAEMEQEGIVVANSTTFSCLLKACASIGAIQQGQQLHAQIVERNLEADMAVGSCLVDMYAKCGSMEDAGKVFDSLHQKNVITWTAMLNGFGQRNEGQQAIQCFHNMLQDGVQPDETTFLCLLVACSHEGLVNQGRQYFNSMVKDHGVVPTRQHYSCMVDLFGRSGHLDEAEKMLMSMPFEKDVVGYISLLNACKIHRDVERGMRCFESLIALGPEHASAYMLMAQIYADAGMWTGVDRIEELRKAAGASKKPARAGIEVNRQVQTFVVGEERGAMSSKLRAMNAVWKEGGHLPHTELVLKPGSEKEKEDELCGHAEKLALAYGLLNTHDGAPLLVIKNLRMCGDCHSSTKVMSRIENRQITVRDAHRIHRFADGSCSCGDRP